MVKQYLDFSSKVLAEMGSSKVFTDKNEFF